MVTTIYFDIFIAKKDSIQRDKLQLKGYLW